MGTERERGEGLLPSRHRHHKTTTTATKSMTNQGERAERGASSCSSGGLAWRHSVAGAASCRPCRRPYRLDGGAKSRVAERAEPAREASEHPATSKGGVVREQRGASRRRGGPRRDARPGAAAGRRDEHNGHRAGAPGAGREHPRGNQRHAEQAAGTRQGEWGSQSEGVWRGVGHAGQGRGCWTEQAGTGGRCRSAGEAGHPVPRRAPRSWRRPWTRTATAPGWRPCWTPCWSTGWAWPRAACST